MEHVVFFPDRDGRPSFRRTPTLEEAVRLVEHLRNVESVSDVEVHALTAVPLSFRAWVRVEIGGSSAEGPAEEPVMDVPALEPPVGRQAPETEALEPDMPMADAMPADAADTADDEPASDGRSDDAAPAVSAMPAGEDEAAPFVPDQRPDPGPPMVEAPARHSLGYFAR